MQKNQRLDLPQTVPFFAGIAPALQRYDPIPLKNRFILKSAAMIAAEKTIITVSTTVNAPVQKVWECWTKPEHIVNWNNASADWCTPRAENDLRKGGRFSYRMEACDGSMGFDFTGEYTDVEPYREIAYLLEDGRKVRILFTEESGSTGITESFEAEGMHSAELQRSGWQAIVDNFKQYVESSAAGNAG